MRPLVFALCVSLSAGGVSAEPARAPETYFEIRVVDAETGRGVPLVEVETVNAVRYVTDSSGLIAFHEPEMMGRRVFFSVRSHGYEHAADGFGYRGKALDVTPGGSATLKVNRVNIAERLYRVTGAGIYRDTVLLGRRAPTAEPLLNAQVLGSDSVVNAVYRGRIHWFWGDTSKPSYPLGNFHVPGAVSELPSEGGLDPSEGVDLSYFVGDDGFARPTAQMPGDGPTWIDGLIVLDDGDRERMFCAYAKIKPPLTTYERGIAEFDDRTRRFEKVVEIDLDAPAYPRGHPFRHTVGDHDYVYFAHYATLVRVRATPEALQQADEYEAFTCLVEGSRVDDPKLERTAEGTLRYSWKRNAPPLGAGDQKKLVDSGRIKAGETLILLRDHETGKSVHPHSGSVYWNEYRQRWVMITSELFGSSMLGETWYAEADTPVGPWVYAEKIVTHDQYSFYNPKQHPMFDQEGGRTIFFEGTYTQMFSGNPRQTPRYDYNQIMYRLDLSDQRLVLPVPIYLIEQDGTERIGHRGRLGPRRPERIALFALERPRPDAVAVYESMDDDGRLSLKVAPADGAGDRRPAFYALPADTDQPPVTARPLYEFVCSESGRRTWSTDREPASPDLTRSPRPLCLVWDNPVGWTADLKAQ